MDSMALLLLLFCMCVSVCMHVCIYVLGHSLYYLCIFLRGKEYGVVWVWKSNVQKFWKTLGEGKEYEQNILYINT